MTHQHLGPRTGDRQFDHDHADGGRDHTHGHGETWRISRPRPRPRIYIAGVISADPVGGVRDGIEAWFQLWDAGYSPFLPHLDLLLQLQRPLPWSDWLEYDFRWVEVCDAVYRIPGQVASPGADRECAYAEERGIPVARAGLNALIALCPPADAA